MAYKASMKCSHVLYVKNIYGAMKKIYGAVNEKRNMFILKKSKISHSSKIRFQLLLQTILVANSTSSGF